MRLVRALPGVDTEPRIVAVTLLIASMEGAIGWRFGLSAALPAYLVFGAVSVAVTVTDLTTRRIPRAVMAPSYPLAIALLAVASGASGQWWPLARGGIAMVLVSGFYLALGLAFPGQMGGGDPILGGWIGLYLGYLPWSTLFAGVLAAWLLAALVVLARRAATGASGTLPAAPFLVAGALVAVLATR